MIKLLPHKLTFILFPLQVKLTVMYQGSQVTEGEVDAPDGVVRVLAGPSKGVPAKAEVRQFRVEEGAG